MDEEEEKEEGVGEGEELGAVEEELAGPAVGETLGKKERKTASEEGRSRKQIRNRKEKSVCVCG